MVEYKIDNSKISDMYGNSLGTAVFKDKLYLVSDDKEGNFSMTSSLDGNFKEKASRISNWTGNSLGMAVFKDKLYITHTNKSGSVYIASSADGNFKEAPSIGGWSGKNLSMTVFKDKLYIAHLANDKDGSVHIASSSDGNFAGGATRINGWTGNSLGMTVFKDKLYIALANNSGNVYIASSSDGNFAGGATQISGWVGKNLSITSYNGRLYIAYANTAGNIFIASSLDGNFSGETTQLSSWAGNTLNLATFKSRLHLFCANNGVFRGQYYTLSSGEIKDKLIKSMPALTYTFCDSFDDASAYTPLDLSLLQSIRSASDISQFTLKHHTFNDDDFAVYMKAQVAKWSYTNLVWTFTHGLFGIVYAVGATGTRAFNFTIDQSGELILFDSKNGNKVSISCEGTTSANIEGYLPVSIMF